MSRWFPRPWVRLLLDDPAGMRRIAATCPEFAELQTKPALCSVGPGVLARLTIGPLDPATARACYPDGAPDVGAILDLSGGDPTDDTRLGCRAPDPTLNRMAREYAANMRMLLRNPADPDDLDDPPSLARVRAVVRAAVRVAEHAMGVVVPEARTSYTVPDFVERSDRNDDLQSIPGRLTLTAYKVNRTGSWLQSQGNIVYALPEVGVCLRVFDPKYAAEVVNALISDMQTWAYAPPEGEELELLGERWRVSRAGVGVWLVAERDHQSADACEASRHANYQASFSTIAQQQFAAMHFVDAT